MRADSYRWFVRGAALTLGAALAIAIVYGLWLGVRVVVLVFIALLLASGLEPLIDRVRTRTALGRGATLLAVYVTFFATVAVVVLLVVPGAINQFNDLGPKLTPLIDSAREWARTIQFQALGASLVALLNTVQKTLAPSAPQTPNPDELIALGLTFADLAISVISVLALVYFWLTERAHLQRFALALVPAERRAGAREAWNEVELQLGSWVRAQLILMGAIGVATTIAYFLIGLEGALVLGMIAALAELIPLVGPALGAVPALLVAAMTGRIETVLLVAAVYIVIQIVEGNVLVPMVMRNTVGVPPFLVFASILAGAAIGGVIGALLAVPLTAALLVVVERLQARAETVPVSPAGATEAVEPT